MNREDEIVIRDRVIQELKNTRAENATLKSNFDKTSRLLYNIIDGLNNTNNVNNCQSVDDYYFAIETLLSVEVETWFEINKQKFEEERLDLIKISALNKLSVEEKKALGF